MELGGPGPSHPSGVGRRKGDPSGRATTPRSLLADRSRDFTDERIPRAASRPTTSRGHHGGGGGARHLVPGGRRGTSREAEPPPKERPPSCRRSVPWPQPCPAPSPRSAYNPNSPPAVPFTAEFCPSPIAPSPTPTPRTRRCPRWPRGRPLRPPGKTRGGRVVGCEGWCCGEEEG